MKTHKIGNYIFWFDWHIKSWTVTKRDNEGNQIGTAEYYANKCQLLANYPQFKKLINKPR